MVKSPLVTLPATPESASAPSLRRRLFSDGLALLWLLNFLAVAAVAAWILFDRSAAHILGLADPAPYTTWFPTGGSSAGIPRGAALRAGAALGAVGFAFISLVIFTMGLFFGPREQRGLRSWLALTALVALWAGVMASSDDLAWRGECWHMRRQLDQFEAVADRLRTDWPLRDGQLPLLGNFTAYPVGRPHMLLMFVAKTPPGRATIAAVERSPAGALRFALASEQTGEWLEWHPPESRPASFKGALSEYNLKRATPLGAGWHLTSYQ